MATIHHQVSINAPLAKVYEAISTAEGFGTWWDKQTPTKLDFRQIGYDERNEFYGSNNFAWGQVLQNLKQVVEADRS